MQSMKMGLKAIHRDIGRNKYNGFIATTPAPDMSKEYRFFRDGWRRKTRKGGTHGHDVSNGR